jgi:hypothetical protein
MKTFLVGLIIAAVCNFAQAAEVTATGYGSSFDEALQNAKVLATEQVSSTFVTGKQELTNGIFKETLGQYNGGVIQSYIVKSVAISGGMYTVKIVATINTDKVNVVAAPSTVPMAVIIPQVDKAASEYEKTADALAAINKASRPFAITSGSNTYTAYDGNIVNVVYHLNMIWNPKWIDDVRQLTRTIARSPVSGTTTKAVCYKLKVDSPGACGGILILPNTDQWRKIGYTATIHHIDGTMETRYAFSSAADLYLDAWTNIQEDGWFKPVVEVTSLTLYTAISTPFEYNARFTVDEFKTISSVTFEPRM